MAELEPYEAPPEFDGAGSSSMPPGKLPPQDLQAEQSVIGGMMLSKDAIADVIAEVKGSISTARRTRRSSTRSPTCTAEVSRRTPSPSPTS